MPFSVLALRDLCFVLVNFLHLNSSLLLWLVGPLIVFLQFLAFLSALRIGPVSSFYSALFLLPLFCILIANTYLLFFRNSVFPTLCVISQQLLTQLGF